MQLTNHFNLILKSRVSGRYVAPLTIEKTTADDLDVDDNHILTVENSNGRSGVNVASFFFVVTDGAAN